MDKEEDTPLDDAIEKAMALLMEHSENCIIITQTGADYPSYEYGGSFFAIKGSCEHVLKYLGQFQEEPIWDEDEDEPEFDGTPGYIDPDEEDED